MTDIDLPGLAACPFCGSNNIDPKGWASLKETGPACDDCGASAESVERWNTRAASAPDGVVACRVMTPEEYQAFKIQGWHYVHKDYDGFGAIAVSYGVAPQSFTSGHVAGQREMQGRCEAVADNYPCPPSQTDDYDSGFIDATSFIAEAIASLPVSAGGDAA